MFKPTTTTIIVGTIVFTALVPTTVFHLHRWFKKRSLTVPNREIRRQTRNILDQRDESVLGEDVDISEMLEVAFREDIRFKAVVTKRKIRVRRGRENTNSTDVDDNIGGSEETEQSCETETKASAVVKPRYWNRFQNLIVNMLREEFGDLSRTKINKEIVRKKAVAIMRLHGLRPGHIVSHMNRIVEIYFYVGQDQIDTRRREAVDAVRLRDEVMATKTRRWFFGWKQPERFTDTQ